MAILRFIYFKKGLENALSYTCKPPVSTMKEMSLDGMVLVHSGEEWPHARAPCSKEMTRHLEHNEKIVSWLQPNGGGVEEQVQTAFDHLCRI